MPKPVLRSVPRAAMAEPEGIVIARERPDHDDLALLMARHAAEMRAETPPESAHMMSAAELARDPGIAFFVLRIRDMPVAMGALRRIAPGHAELKSMHVLAESRGGGLARRILAHLLAEARSAGLVRVSLETGVMPIYAPARALYLSAGFRECPPFGSYRPDPNSVFFTIDL